MKTYSAKPDDIKRDWYVVNASGKTLGRLASENARRLRRKHKAEYTPDIQVTGNKQKDKIYHHHTGYPGGIESISFEKLIEKKPEQIIEKAVKGMLPKGPLGREMFRKLKVYADDKHQHTAQQPQVLEI